MIFGGWQPCLKAEIVETTFAVSCFAWGRACIEPLHTTIQCTQTHTWTTSNPDPFLCPRTVLLSMAHNCYFLQLPYNNLTMFSAIRKMVLTFLVLILSKFLKLHRTINNINNIITIFLILGVVRKQHNIILVVNLFIVVWE